MTARDPMLTRRALIVGSLASGIASLLPEDALVAYATKAALQAETDARIKADADLSARIAALENAPAPAPTPTVTPSGAVEATFTGKTSDEFVAMVRAQAQDVIRIPAGTYAAWQPSIHADLTRPVVIKPVAGAKCYFDGVGVKHSGQGAMHFGSVAITDDGGNVANGYPTGPTTNIVWDGLLDSLGSQFVFQNYSIGQSGLWLTGWVRHIGLHRLMVRGITGMGGSYSHVLYVNSDGNDGLNPSGGHRSFDIASLECDVVLPKSMNGTQLYHKPNADGVAVTRWKASGGHTFAYVYGDGSNVVYDGNVISGFDRSFESAETVTGTYRNNIATSTGAPSFGAPGFVDGGGNSL